MKATTLASWFETRRKRNAPHHEGMHRWNYFSEVLIEVNFVLRFVPSPFTMEMIASEMPAAIRPYSMAVAPLSSFKNFLMSVTSAVPLPCPRKPFWIERRASLAAWRDE